MIRNTWKSKIVSYSYTSERIVIVRLKIDRGHLTVIEMYATEEGKLGSTVGFYDTLQKELNKVLNSDYVYSAGEFIARVGKRPIEEVVGTFGKATLNTNGQELRQFVSFNKLKIINTFYGKRDIHKYTWVARGQESLIDYVIV